MATINENTGEIITTAPTTVTTPTPTVVPTVAAPTAATVYSADNIAQTVTSPATTYTSPEQQLYTQFMDTAEIKAAKAEAAKTQAAINAAQQALRSTTTSLQNQNQAALGGTGASVNLIGRQVGRARDLTSNELAALGENLQAQQAYVSSLTSEATNRYNIAQQEQSQIKSLIASTMGKAGISLTDSYETALQKAAKYQEDQQREAEKKAKKQAEEEKKQNYKDSLKQTALQLGIKTKGKTIGELEKSLKKYYKNEKEYKKQIEQLELASKKKELAKPYYKETEAKPLDFSDKGLANIIDEEVNTGTDWSTTAAKLEAAGVNTAAGSPADKYLRYKFLGEDNPFAT